jgi:hypothetical protein
VLWVGNRPASEGGRYKEQKKPRRIQPPGFFGDKTSFDTLQGARVIKLLLAEGAMAKKKTKDRKTKTKRASSLSGKASAKGKAAKNKTGKKRKVVRAKRQQRRLLGRQTTGELVSYGRRGMGARSGGQAGDTQGLSASPDVDSESVEELLEEGQSFEAEVLNGVERAPDADQGEVRTHEVPEDDVPEEYRNTDERDGAREEFSKKR